MPTEEEVWREIEETLDEEAEVLLDSISEHIEEYEKDEGK